MRYLLIVVEGGDSCGNAQHVRRNNPRDSEGCGLRRARGKRPPATEINRSEIKKPDANFTSGHYSYSAICSLSFGSVTSVASITTTSGCKITLPPLRKTK